MNATAEILIDGRVYGLAEHRQGLTYQATLESDEGHVYTVRLQQGRWSCNCGDAKYRHPGNCKHVIRLKERCEEAAEDARNPVQESAMTTPNSQSITNTAPQQVTASATEPRPSLSQAFSSQSGRTQLCIALSKAQSAVGRLKHDARNEFHKYDYTSSEAVIEAAKSALGQNGLALLPLEETLNGHARDGEGRFELECKFVLLHQSGEAQPLLRHWPVCPDKGRPLDKATAAASTLCLCYLLRDLLLIPRVNPEDEIAARDDRQTQAARPQKPAKAAPPPPPANGAELETRLKAYDAKVSKAGLCKPGELYQVVLGECWANGKFPARMQDWSAEQCRQAMDTALYTARQMKTPAPSAAKTSG